MALALVVSGNPINAADLNQYFNILTGVMSDQEVTINRARILLASPYRVHRHPYANDRHIESGTGTTAGSVNSTLSVTFTTAYTATPVVTAVVFQASLYSIPSIAVQAESTTGCTIQTASGASPAYSTPVRWHAEGN